MRLDVDHRRCKPEFQTTGLWQDGPSGGRSSCRRPDPPVDNDSAPSCQNMFSVNMTILRKFTLLDLYAGFLSGNLLERQGHLEATDYSILLSGE